MSYWESPIQIILKERDEQLKEKTTLYIEEAYDIYVDKERLLEILKNAKTEW